MDPMQKWTLVVSIIGAAAWVPHLIALAIKLTRKPTLTIMPAAQCQVGFTELGPIFNIKAAITADNQSILVDLVEFEVRHESGATHRFRWHEVSEIKGQMLIPGVASQPVAQESEAIAIKVLPTDFKDLLFKNRMNDHTKGIRKYDYEFIKERRRLVNNNQYDPDTFYVTKVVQDMQAFMQSQMAWKKGSYDIKFLVHTRNGAKTNVPDLRIELSDDDILLLQSNSDNLPKLLKNACYADTPSVGKIQQLEWHWLTKELTTV